MADETIQPIIYLFCFLIGLDAAVSCRRIIKAQERYERPLTSITVVSNELMYMYTNVYQLVYCNTQAGNAKQAIITYNCSIEHRCADNL